MDSCRACLDEPGAVDDLAIEVATALLLHRTCDAWDLALSFLRSHPQYARRVLSRFAHAEPRSRGSQVEREGVSTGQVAELFALLLEYYPPEAEPNHQGAFFVSEEDSAVCLRGELIRWLSVQRSAEALSALKALEQQFGVRYPWLRHPRSADERAYREVYWSHIPPATVATLLVNRSKRLIRSGADALDGVVAAIEDFERSLHHESPSSLEDLWDTPKNSLPTPKAEERISDKLCEAVRHLF
jgi:hypothetical protein